MHVANTKKATTTARRSCRRRRARMAVEPFFCLWFSLVFLCLACTFAKCRTQVATVATSTGSSGSSGYTRGCENSSLAFQKLNCIFPKKGRQHSTSSTRSTRCGWLVWAERKPNYWHLFLVLTLPSPSLTVRLPHGAAAIELLKHLMRFGCQNCGSKVVCGGKGGHHVPGWGCLMLALLMPPN